ncbi:hypothetical protein [Rhodococcoides fascians]|uniref:hypothetical protein n=1 Tax=Rhodococcoides fascians TaxID=1828 RepID=UPI000A5A87C9|nr:hypothetical protein [Rhodococcus fascians]
MINNAGASLESAEGTASATTSRYPADGALVSVTDGGSVRVGWIAVEHASNEHAVGWIGLMPFDTNGKMWTGMVAPEAISVEVADAPEWWNESTSNLLKAVIRSNQQLVGDAHQWADDNNLCSVFDSFMCDHGLPPRRRAFQAPASVTLTLELPVPVTARYGEDAQALINDDLIEQAVRQRFGGLRRHGITVGEYTVGELEERTA